MAIPIDSSFSFLSISLYCCIYIDWLECTGLPWPTRCLSKRIKKDSRSDYGVQTIKKLKKTKSGQRLDDEKR